jgi:hypothetical protein
LFTKSVYYYKDVVESVLILKSRLKIYSNVPLRTFRDR